MLGVLGTLSSSSAIVFVFVFVFSYNFSIAIVIGFQNMYSMGVCEASEQCY